MKSKIQEFMKNNGNRCVWNIPTTNTVRYISPNEKDPREKNECITSCNGLDKTCDRYVSMKMVVQYSKIQNEKKER